VDVFDAARAKQAELGVPGVAVGVLDGDEEHHEGFGVTSIDNPLPVTPSTRFQTGSITKTFTGTAAMLLVDQGLLDLDRPVREYVPELSLADPATSSTVTLRHLLSHTGGWVGDFFDDTGWGDDAAARYVAGMGALPQLTPLGELWSYNNAGFVLAGHVIERVTGSRYEDVVKELVLEPLEMTETTFWPWEVMTERFAVGHAGEGRDLQVARPWPVGRSAHAAGGIISTTTDLLKYARLHLDPPPALAPMQERQADAAAEGEWVGLTWYGEDRHGTIRHGGGTMGQISVLVLVPARGFALAVLTNHSPNGNRVVLEALDAAGLGTPEPDPVELGPLDEYGGTYEMPLTRLTLTPQDGRLHVLVETLGGFPTKDTPPQPSPPPAVAFFYAPDRWLIDEGPLKGSRGHFIRAADGSIAWLRSGGRLFRRL
jgi:CubicO group peptidase (beta-lactamase class C family)